MVEKTKGELCDSAEFNLSRSRVKKLGRDIRHDLRDSDRISNNNLELLQAYRVKHQPPLRETFDFLAKKSKQHFKGSLVVYRLKRIDTIKRKIRRYPTMDLATMQDIAGCRAIVNSNAQIKKIVEEFKKSNDFEILNYDDYLETPRDTGYSSYHLIVKPRCSSKVVEIQLRTKKQHYWATLVEITDLVYGIKLKEGDDHPDLYDFHRLLSTERKSLSIEERETIVKIEKKYSIVEKLITVFKSNYYISIERWIEVLPMEVEEYLIMEIDENLSPRFSFFCNFSDAEKVYFEKFTSKEPEMVLIHTNNPDFEKLGLAYSNYVLTSHPSVRDFLEIIKQNILDNNDIRKFDVAKERIQYLEGLYSLFTKSFISEIGIMSKRLSDKEGLSLQAEEMMTSWLKNLRDRFDYVVESKKEFKKEMDSLKINMINKFIYYLIKGMNVLLKRS